MSKVKVILFIFSNILHDRILASSIEQYIKRKKNDIADVFALDVFSAGFKCPVCSKVVPPEETECHLVICLTKPRISYNGKSTKLALPQ